MNKLCKDFFITSLFQVKNKNRYNRFRSKHGPEVDRKKKQPENL